MDQRFSRNIPITFHTMEDELAVLTLQPRFNAVLLGIFSGIALLLATGDLGCPVQLDGGSNCTILHKVMMRCDGPRIHCLESRATWKGIKWPGMRPMPSSAFCWLQPYSSSD